MLELSGESRSSGNEIRYKVCPVCGHAKWSVSQDATSGASICYKCGARGVGESNAPSPHKLFVPKPARLCWSEVPMPDYKPLGAAARQYLLSRGLKDPSKYGVMELVNAPRLLFPYSGPEGKVIFWSTRYYLPDGMPKYVTATGRPPLYVLPSWQPWEDGVVLVEGILDAIMTHEHTGLPTIALGGKALRVYLKDDLRYLAPGRKTVVLDGDALAAGLKLCASLTNCNIIPLTPGADPADIFGSSHHGEQLSNTIRERNNGSY